MHYLKYRTIFISSIKKLFHINNFTLFVRKRKQSIEKLFYRKKYTADDIIDILKKNGIKSGVPIVIYSSMSNFYNYKGSIDELIDKLIEFVGPDGTLCMPAYPYDKSNTEHIFDVRNSKTAAGILAETFRKRPGVKRSLNQLHSVCALGKDAEKITGEHHLSKICFDEHSPYYIIGQLGGYSIALGLPEWYIGTGSHVCEALLFDELPFFHEKFTQEKEFHYVDNNGKNYTHIMLTGSSSKYAYIRKRTTHLIDTFFRPSKYFRVKLSNIWVIAFDMKYLYTRLGELAWDNKTIYNY